jgi:glycosyltransferase involved in cell wall biosynthesis
LKRLDLLVEAAARMRADGLAFKIAGEGQDEPRLRERIRALGLAGRVELLGAIDERELVDHYARCRAVFFAPWNEDYGFVTLEAFRSGKAVVTTVDSGGPSELVVDGVNGLMSEATPDAVAAGLDRLARERPLAETLGQAALAAAQEHTWPRAVEFLLRD